MDLVHVAGTAFVAVNILANCALAGDPCIAPEHESCDGAISFAFEDLPLTITGALGCGNDMVDRPYFDVFYQYDCTVSGTYTFDMCGAFGDSYMRIYVDGCGFAPASSWVEDDDGCGNAPILDPLITLDLEAGTSYWIELGAWRDEEFFPPNANDPYEFHVTFDTACPGDLDRSGAINTLDLLILLAGWGQNGPGADIAKPPDTIDTNDLLGLLGAWGACPSK